MRSIFLWYSPLGDSHVYHCETTKFSAKPTYSAIRSMILQLTPGDSRCRLYCKGPACLYCNVYHGESAIPGLYSTWITENIVAMARPQAVHFENDEIIQLFKRNNVRAVFNLQEAGEHSFCGTGNLTGGFSYDPECLMKNESGSFFTVKIPFPIGSDGGGTLAVLIEKVGSIVLCTTSGGSENCVTGQQE
uniref:But2 domain-containing protein n=1 Tax=Angiostrongylus cantonensis TaxID=6313 RepID=A0A0K0D153_ANGCA